MPKRVSAARIKTHQSYTVADAVAALGVGTGTIRQWVRDGLPILRGKRPYLLLGRDIKEFVKIRTDARRCQLAKNEVFCLSCRKPRKPEQGLVEIRFLECNRPMVAALCPTCGATCNRLISASATPDWSALCAVA